MRSRTFLSYAWSRHAPRGAGPRARRRRSRPQPTDDAPGARTTALREWTEREAGGASLFRLPPGATRDDRIHDVATVLVKELESQDEAHIAFEEYPLDESMRVLDTSSSVGGENVRLVELRKTRGHGHISGRHPFVLGSEGLEVHLRLRPADVRFGLRSVADGNRRHVSSGNTALDAMLDGGFWEGSVNLASGFRGAGNSVLTHEFVHAPLERGEHRVHASFHASNEDLIGGARTLGLD